MRTVLVAFALALAAGSVSAQQPAQPKTDSTKTPAPETVQGMGPMLQQMGPMMAQMAALTLEGTFTALAKRENAERLADFTKNYYDALIKRGFTKEQALQIVMAVGIPRSASTGR